jgi:uncharacterized protein (TIGR02118 family)
MYKIVAFWEAPKPSDLESFEKYYQGVHVPLARKVPHMRKLVLTRTEQGLEDATAPFHRVAELHFDNPEAFHRASETAQWRAMREDAGKIVGRFGVTLKAGVGWERE